MAAAAAPAAVAAPPTADAPVHADAPARHRRTSASDMVSAVRALLGLTDTAAAGRALGPALSSPGARGAADGPEARAVARCGLSLP